MKKIFAAIMVFSLAAEVALALGGTTVNNGGDPNEPIFKDIATNIEGWIQSGNADQIRLPSFISLEVYKQKMLAALANYNISFSHDKVIVDGAEKTCKNYVDIANRFQILCNSQSFSLAYKNDLNDVYRLVHHEFAGLAGLEINQGQKSDYAISDQVSAYLKDEQMKRLPIVKPAWLAISVTTRTGGYISFWGTCGTNNSAVTLFAKDAGGVVFTRDLPCLNHHWVFNEVITVPGYLTCGWRALQDGRLGTTLSLGNLTPGSTLPEDLICETPYDGGNEWNTFFGQEVCSPVVRCANGRPYMYENRPLDSSLCASRAGSKGPSLLPQRVVQEVNIDLFSDAGGKHLIKDLKGVKIFNSVSGKSEVFPTRGKYAIGERVTWNWSQGTAWGPTWSLDPQIHLLVQAWENSEEFAGSDLTAEPFLTLSNNIGGKFP